MSVCDGVRDLRCDIRMAPITTSAEYRALGSGATVGGLEPPDALVKSD